MRITVVTVVRNAKAALEKTVESVLAQDARDLEYVLVDGASTDGGAEWLAERFGPSGRAVVGAISVRWSSEPDRGLYDAMNKGVALATGRYCAFMNAGDRFVSNDVVSRVASRIEDGDDVVYGDVVKNGRCVVASSPRNSHRMFYCHQSAFTSVACLRAVPFDLRHPMSADFKQAKQLFLAGKRFRHVPFPVADFDVTGVSTVRRSAGLRDNMAVVREIDGFFDCVRFLPHLAIPLAICALRGK